MMNLDSQQQEAIKTVSKRALVLAGAGSGKTRVLIERIAHLVETQHVSPYEIMAFTFTRKAAGEIKTRLEERIGKQAYHVTMGTMHSLALEMIHRFGDLIGLRKTNVTVYGEWEESFLLKDVAESVGMLKGKTWKIPKKDINEMFDLYYQSGIEPTENHPGRNLFTAFIHRCKENNSVTYGGLLTGLRMLIPELAKYLHIKHILVDEVQDIDPLQWLIINDMVEQFGASLFVVGDIDQSIYEWRGAVPKYLVEQQESFDVYRLETNYRSVSEIVEASNKLISNNQDRIPKTMTSVRESSPLAAANVQIHRDADSEQIVSIAGAWHCPEAPTVILSRIHGLLEKIDRLMTEENIKHVYVGKDTTLTNSEAFRRFHAFLKLIINPYDNFSFLLIRDLIGCPLEHYSKIRIEAAQEGKSHFQVWALIEKGFDFFEVAHGNNFPNVIRRLLESVVWPFPIDAITNFVAAFIGDPQNEKWNEDACDEGPIQKYLDWLATYNIQDEIKAEETEGITLMTVHAAKGLEWPVVIVAGCNEGILPSKQALNNGELEAERRLMYVAMTRAKDQLILTVRPEVTEKDGRIFESPQSRFVLESVSA